MQYLCLANYVQKQAYKSYTNFLVKCATKKKLSFKIIL